MGRPD